MGQTKKTTAQPAASAKAAVAAPAPATSAAPGVAAAVTPATKTVPGIRVKSRIAGFRRAGIAWAAEPTDIVLSDLSKGQRAQIRAEPMLVVEDIMIPASPESVSLAGATTE